MTSDARGANQVQTETTPLISRTEEGNPRKAIVKPIDRVLLCAFLVSLAFGVTQVPCAIPEVEASTARAVSLLGCSTTFFGVANLFITGHGIRRYGVKAALALQVFWPAARLAIQNVGVMVGGSNGIIIVQASQILTIIGGPTGYQLALNNYVAEVTVNKERTGYLGRLQGCTMFGSAAGFLIGGILADSFSIITPFQVTLGLFLLSTVYVVLCLPWIAPQKEDPISTKGQSAFWKAFGSLEAIMPAKWILRNGRTKTEYGPPFLAAGVFMAVLATGWIPSMLQMYATDAFGFGTRSNSYLVSSHSFLRGLFLTLAFPKIIAAGRHFIDKSRKNSETSQKDRRKNFSDDGDATPIEDDVTEALQEEEQDVMPPKPSNNDEQEQFAFDLIFTRFSLLTDGLLTLGASFVQEGWQMYLVGAILPLGAGTASAAKGVILQMSPPTERTQALSALAFAEMIARLSTMFVFGLIFAAFARVGKTHLVFTCNAAVALLGFAVLLFARFPEEGSTRLDAKIGEEAEEEPRTGSDQARI